MRKELDLDNWSRRSHFDFFKDFDEPFFGVTANVDCTYAFENYKNLNTSFFLYYLYQSLVVVNSIEEFRYRIEGEKVFVYDEIGASATINRPDGTFGFSYLNFHKDFKTFEHSALAEIEKVRADNRLIPGSTSANVIHYSSVPWIKFTSLSHARKFDGKDSVPKITFGKVFRDHDRYKMPVSVHVHHALMDGFHLGRYFEQFEQTLGYKE
ncbi:MAG: chloramphenicol acetyltransferase [Bacteroidota bacterium]